MPSKIRLTSFEDASLLRKLTILYFVMSIIPVSVLYYLYLQLRDTGHITITENTFFWTLTWVVIGVGIGYAAMRSMIIKIVEMTKQSTQTIEHLLGKETARSISQEDSNEVAVLAKSFNEITSRLEENVRNLELAKKTLHSVLARVGEGISSMDNIDNFLALIIETVTEALEAQTGFLLLGDEKRTELTVKAVYGRELKAVKHLRVKYGSELFKPAITGKQACLITSIPKEPVLSRLFKLPLICAPLALHDDVLGLIVVSGRKTGAAFETDELTLLYNLALQTAVAIENSKLNADAEKTYFETISALALAVEAKDPYSRGHLDRVARLVVKIATQMNRTQEEINMLRDAAKLHDIGKIGVMDHVLAKPGKLNAEEVEMMKKHCEIGEGIIKPIRSLRSLCDIIRHHHEKLDGTGYPDGLKGDEIHPLVRILTVADIYDALTTSRPYREPFSKEKAMESLHGMKEAVDQQVVDALGQVLA